MSSSPETHYLKDYTPSDFEVEKIELSFEIFENYTLVHSEIDIIQKSNNNTSSLSLVLDGESEMIDLQSIKINNSLYTDFEKTQDHLILKSLPTLNQFKLNITVKTYPEKNSTLNGLYQSGSMICTQCESHGFRRITYMLDRPDVMTRYTVKISADKSQYPVLLSNGDKIDSGELEHNRHYVIYKDPHKKPTYLFALVAGKLSINTDQFITQSGKKVNLELYTRPEDSDRSKVDFALQSLKRSMAWDEERFGREYDLNTYMIVAVSDFNMGAMENKGLNIFNTKYVFANPKTETDSDFIHVEAVIGHEYFHNWTGNRITCRDWFQLSLKEGLTVFRDQEFTSDLHNRDIKRIEDAKIIRSAQFAEDASPMAHPIRPISYIEMNNFYTVTVYNKGAEIIRMQYTLAGHEGFRKGMDLYFNQFDGQAITCDDFADTIAKANNLDFSQFKHWYNQAGTPIVSIQTEYNANLKQYTLFLKQHCEPTPDGSPKDPFVIPLKYALFSQNGKSLQSEKCFILNKSSDKLILNNITEEPVLSILRSFSAPVKLDFNQSSSDLSILIAHDNDGFAQWDAAQRLAQRAIFDLAKNKDNSENTDSKKALIKSYQKLLENYLNSNNNSKTSSHMLGELLQLPSLQTLFEASSNQNLLLDDLQSARNQLEHQLSHDLKDLFIQIYQMEIKKRSKDYILDNTHIGRRALCGQLLHWIALSNIPNKSDLIKDLYHSANNMTEKLAAFKAVLKLDLESNSLKSELIEDFYNQYKNEDLVVNKWFMLQACISSNNPLAQLEKIKTLLNHPAFTLNNPNKVYALIGGFTQNWSVFHHSSGSGYKLLADIVLDLNHNPQVAARMVRALMSHNRFDENRSILMKTQLQRILDTPDLSKDVYEIVEKSLK